MVIRLKLKNFRAKPRVLVITQRVILHSFSTIYQHQKSPAKLGFRRNVSCTKCLKLVIFRMAEFDKWQLFYSKRILTLEWCTKYARVLPLLIIWELCICLTSTRNLIISTLGQNLQHTHFHKKGYFFVDSKNFPTVVALSPTHAFRIFPKHFDLCNW